MRVSYSAVPVVAVIVVGLAAPAARAGLQVQFDTTRAQTAKIMYTGHTGSSENVYVGPFVVTDPSTSSSVDAFCVDLATSVGTGLTTINTTTVTNIASLNNSSALAVSFPDSGFADVGNRMSFLMSQILPVIGGTSNEFAALQLALWAVLDQNFTYTSSNSVMNGYFNDYMGRFSGSGAVTYNSATDYGAGVSLLWQTPQVGRHYQNLITYSEPQVTATAAVPEPSTLTMASFAGMIMALYGVRRLRRTGPPLMAA